MRCDDHGMAPAARSGIGFSHLGLMHLAAIYIDIAAIGD